MSKATALNAHFQQRTGSFSTHGSRTGVNLLGWDIGSTEHMTPEQEREVLQARCRQLHDLCASGEITKTQRRQVGKEIFNLQTRIKAIRPKLKTPGIERFFMEAACECLNQNKFREIFNEAHRKYAQHVNEQNTAIAAQQGKEGGV